MASMEDMVIAQKIKSGVICPSRHGLTLVQKKILDECCLVLPGITQGSSSYNRFLKMLGPTLFAVLLSCIITKKGFEQIEKDVKIPSRSGKALLKCALEIVHANS